jgi:N-acetyl-anhydromuramyl-L-alanine amidase AmpD
MKTFTPDSSTVSDVIPSPNFGDRNKGRAPDMILLHYTGMPDVEGAIKQLCTVGTEVSAHYIVLEDGRIVQSVPEGKRAWHAGVSSWGGEDDINSCSIGIEIVNRGHDWGYPDFPSRQIAAVTALCRGIMLRREVPSHRVLAHSDVAPSRKNPVAQEGSRRKISLAFPGQFRRRPLGAAGADRAQRELEDRQHRRRRPEPAAGAGQIRLWRAGDRKI